MELNDFIKNMIGFLETQLTPIPPIEPPPVYIPIIFKVDTKTNIVDGRKAPFNEVKPGDIIELESGLRAPLALMNLKGSDERPIIITNDRNGAVEIDSSSGWYGFWLRNCNHFSFAGTGCPSVEYGIKITRAQSNGIIFEKKTNHFEMSHIQISRVDGSVGFGIQGQTRLTNGSPDYDFNGDGKIDASDNVTRENYIDGDWHIHNFLIDGGTDKRMNMALYVGNSNYLEEKNPLVENVHIHNMIIRNIATKVFQVGSVVKGLDIHDIDIRNSSWSTSSIYPMAISVNPGSNGKVYNCTIMDCGGYGIGWLGTGGHIFNNLIVRCGRPNTYFIHGIYVSYKQPWTHGKPTHIYNNTIINPIGYGVLISDMLTGVRTVSNNLIVNLRKTYVSATAGTITKNNIELSSVDTAKFVDSGKDDYSLALGSPAINAGYDVSEFGLTHDIVGTARPSGSAYDIGAYERKG